MKRIFQLALVFLCMGMAGNVLGQRVVLIEAQEPFVDIFPIIVGDTTATGERNDLNTIYQLENGGLYVVSQGIESAGGWPLHIEAVDLEDLDNKPIITRIPNASGSYPFVFWARGDLTLKNLWLITGETGPLEDHNWGGIRMLGPNSKVIVDDCLIEKDRGGFLQLRADGVKCYVNRCTFRNGGNRRILEGNGRGIDARTFAFDTLIVRNTIIHNIIDRIFRSHNGVLPHNYIEFDHNTVFNHAGRHGGFQFGRVKTAKITNNLFINPNMLGTSPRWTDEQLQPDNDKHKVFTVDELLPETKFTFAANNIFWDQELLDYYASNDTVERVPIYSELILQSLGNDGVNPEDTYFQEPLSLNSVPVSLFQYVQDYYADPSATDMFDFVVEDISRVGTPFENENIFDFSTFDPCYSTELQSATADTGGGAVGAVFFCDGLEEGTGTQLPTVVEIIVESPDHNLLEQAVGAAGLVDALSGEGPFTVFAPTDAAVAAVPNLQELLANQEALAEVLQYHVVAGKVLSTDLSDGMTATTLLGKDISVRIEANGDVFINDVAMVITPDIEASNGVVHVINAVLLPPADPEPPRYYLIEGNETFVDIFPVIAGDTTETGERVSLNTIYQLENGKVYVVSQGIESAGGWPLHIEAVDLQDTKNKPIVTRIPNASGSYPFVFWARGDLTLRNLWLITGETGPLEDHNWGGIRMLGPNSRVRVSDCLIEKDRGGFLQLRADGVKCYVDRCIFRNGGNRRIVEGNGRGIDARTFSFDTLIVRNTVIHNIIDRIFRSHNGVLPHNYIEFDHNTVFNHAGRHGGFQFGRVKTVKITNNMFINPNMLGTSPRWTDEQLQPDNDKHKVFTVDELLPETKFTFAANNIFWDQELLDYYASNDTVELVPIYSELILQSLGDDGVTPEDTYFQEPLSLNNVPVSLFQYVQDFYADPSATDMFDFVVEDISRVGTPYENENIFDFCNFDPFYSQQATSYTAGTDGLPVGVTEFNALTGACVASSVFEANVNNTLNLAVFPNPMNGQATFTYHLNNNSEVRLSIYNIMGQELDVLVIGKQSRGDHTVNFNRANRLTRGLYVARLQTEEGQMALKIMVR